jgi:hypothetical protein
MKPIRLLIVNFLQKTKLNKLAHKIYYTYFHGFKPATKEIGSAIEIAFKKAMELGTANNGDYYEFGLFKGYAFWYAQNTANKYGLKRMRFFGFDSFQGLPKVKGKDETKEEIFYEGQYTCLKEKVIENLERNGVDWKKTFLIEGFFENSLNESTKENHHMNKVAVALIDCDLYSSTVEVLKFLENIIMNETILIFDDWNCFDKDNERGQRKAFREFIERNRHLSAEDLFTYGFYGQAFVIKMDSV